MVSIELSVEDARYVRLILDKEIALHRNNLRTWYESESVQRSINEEFYGRAMAELDANIIAATENILDTLKRVSSALDV